MKLKTEGSPPFLHSTFYILGSDLIRCELGIGSETENQPYENRGSTICDFYASHYWLDYSWVKGDKLYKS
jgi:hypothetical protein